MPDGQPPPPARPRPPESAGVRTPLGRNHPRPPGVHLRRPSRPALARRPPHPDLAPTGSASTEVGRPPRRGGRARIPGRAAVPAGDGLRHRVPGGTHGRTGRRSAVSAGPARTRRPARDRTGGRESGDRGDDRSPPRRGTGLLRPRPPGAAHRGRPSARHRRGLAVGHPARRRGRLPPVHVRVDPVSCGRGDHSRQCRRQRPSGAGRLRCGRPFGDLCGLAAPVPRHGARPECRRPCRTRSAVGTHGSGRVPPRTGALAAAARRASACAERGAQLRLRLLHFDRHRGPEIRTAAGRCRRADQRQRTGPPRHRRPLPRGLRRPGVGVGRPLSVVRARRGHRLRQRADPGSRCAGSRSTATPSPPGRRCPRGPTIPEP